MAQAHFEIYRGGGGAFKWRLFDENGDWVQIKPGDIAGSGMNRQERAKYRTAVQAGLKALYERQQPRP